MRWVDQASTRPMRCAVVPYVGNGSGHSFIDTGQDLDLEHVYISDVAAQAIAQMLGWVPPGELDARERELVALRAELVELRAQVERQDQELEAIDILASRGFQARKKPGRKPKEEVTA